MLYLYPFFSVLVQYKRTNGHMSEDHASNFFHLSNSAPPKFHEFHRIDLDSASPCSLWNRWYYKAFPFRFLVSHMIRNGSF